MESQGTISVGNGHRAGKNDVLHTINTKQKQCTNSVSWAGGRLDLPQVFSWLSFFRKRQFFFITHFIIFSLRSLVFPLPNSPAKKTSKHWYLAFFSRPDLMVKKLRYYARFIVVCLLLKKMKLVRDLVRVSWEPCFWPITDAEKLSVCRCFHECLLSTVVSDFSERWDCETFDKVIGCAVVRLQTAVLTEVSARIVDVRHAPYCLTSIYDCCKSRNVLHFRQFSPT